MSDPIRVGLIGLGRAGTGMHRKELVASSGQISVLCRMRFVPERCQAFHDDSAQRLPIES